jgi:hypothetical protein
MRELTLLEWVDSLGCPQGWQLLEDTKAVFVRIQSVGWVIDETSEAITLAPHLGFIGEEPNQAQGIMTIPKRCISSRTTLQQ